MPHAATSGPSWFPSAIAIAHLLVRSVASLGRSITAALLVAALAASSAAGAATLLGPVVSTSLPQGQDPVAQSGSYGRVGGATLTFGNIQLANVTPVWHTDFPGGVNATGGNQTFDAAQSDLPNGKLVFTNATARTTLQYLTLGDVPIALATPASVGAPSDVGGLAPVPSAGFKLNYLVDVGGQPAEDWYDANHAMGDPPFFFDLASGFYWNNVDPALDANTGMTVGQGQTVSITAAMLSSSDVESGPAQVTYTVTGAPVRGTLRKGGAPLNAGSTFTQQDVGNGQIDYVNDNTCNASDGFQFGVTDANGGIANISGATSFLFPITVSLPNLPPTANNGVLTLGLGVSKSGTLTASNNDCYPPTYTYQLFGAGPAKGNVVLDNASTGQYTYTASAGQSGSDTFDFKVSDGNSLSIAAGTISITIGNIAPTALSQSVSTTEGIAVSGTLQATDPDQPPQSFSYSLVVNGAKGMAQVTNAATGAFTYTPSVGQIGTDTFTFKASDGFADSAPATATVTIRADMQIPGRIVTTGGSSQAVVAVDATNGSQSVVSSSGSIVQARGVAVESSGAILVVDGGSGPAPSGTLLRIDPSTGGQSVVASSLGPFAYGVAVEGNGNIVLALGTSGVKRINPVTGAVLDTFTSANMTLPLGIAVASNGDLYVADAGSFFAQPNRISKLDPVTGALTVVSEDGNLSYPVSLAFAKNGTLYVTNAPELNGPGTSSVIAIDVSTGAQTLIASGAPLGTATGVVVAANGTLLTANGSGNGSIVRVTPGSPATMQPISSGGELSGTFGIALSPEVAPLPKRIPDGTVGVVYGPQTFDGSGGHGPYSFAVTGGTLPPGVTLTGASLGGTPTEAGNFNVTITATDSSGATLAGPYSGSRDYSGTIAKGSQTIAFAPLPDRSLYSGSFALSATATSTLPVSFSSDTPLVCTVNAATVTLLKTGACTLRATQSGDNNWNAAADVTQGFTVTAPPISINPQSVPGGTVGTPYATQTLVGSGGNGPYAFLVTAGTLPAGLALSTGGSLSGTPSTGGNFSFTVTATDASSNAVGGPFTGTQSYSGTIAKTNQTITFDALVDRIVNSGSFNVSATASSTLAVAFGSDTTSICTVSGATVTLIRTGTCTIRASQPGDVSWNAAPDVTRSFNVTAPPITINPSSVVNGTIGAAYVTQTLTGTGGTGPYTFLVTAGVPPAGLTLSNAGSLSGTPTAAGLYNFTITATDSSGAGVGGPFTGSQAYSSTIAKGNQSISFGTLADRSINAGVFNVSATATSGLPVTFASNTVAFCTVNANTVTPVKPGTCTIRATQAGDGNWNAAADVVRSFTITGLLVTMTPQSVPGGTVTVTYPTQTFSASGGTAPYTFAVTSGSLPGGLTLTSAGGLSGTPTAAGPFSFTVTATDSTTVANGGPFTASQAYSVTIAKASSTTTLTANLNPSAPAQLVVFTATMSTPVVGATGTITFMDGAITLCSAVALSGNSAECATSAISPGTHAITAIYSGESNVSGSTSVPLSHTVTSSATTTLNVNLIGSGNGSVKSTPDGVDCGADCSEPYAEFTTVTLDAVPAAGSVFTGWLGACIGLSSPCNVTMATNKSVTAVFAPAATVLKLEVDGNNKSDALSDGLIIIRALFGLTGSPLTAGALGAGATITDPAVIKQHLVDIQPLLDADGNGRVDALTDGLLTIRYMFGLRGTSLTANALGAGATRDAAQIEAYIQALLQ